MKRFFCDYENGMREDADGVYLLYEDTLPRPIETAPKDGTRILVKCRYSKSGNHAGWAEVHYETDYRKWAHEVISEYLDEDLFECWLPLPPEVKR